MTSSTENGLEMRSDSELQQLMAEWQRVTISLERRGWAYIHACSGEAGAVLQGAITDGPPEDCITITRDINQWLAVQKATGDARWLRALADLSWGHSSCAIEESAVQAFDAQLIAGIENARRRYDTELERLAKLEQRLFGDISPASESRLH